MKKYKPIVLSEAENRLTERLKAHVRQMFPIAQPGGHDQQHVLSQLDLWDYVGGSIMEEFDNAFDPFLPVLYIPGHDLNRLPIFEGWARKLKMETKGLAGAALERAEAHNAQLAAENRLVEERMVAMYDGLLRHLKAPNDLRKRVLKLMVEIGGPNKPEDPADLIACGDLDKCIVGAFYAWRCAAVGAGHRVGHVTKRYRIASSEVGGHLLPDEELTVWTDDLEWACGAKGWDPCTATDKSFILRSDVLHEIADPDFETLRDLKARTLKQLQRIGYRG